MNLIAYLTPLVARYSQSIEGDTSLEQRRYFSKEATAIDNIEPGGKGQVYYEGTYWIGLYASGEKTIHSGQKVYVGGLDNHINLRISEHF